MQVPSMMCQRLLWSVLLLVMLFAGHGHCVFNSTRFHRGAICNVTDSLARGCSKQISAAQPGSIIQCTLKCWTDSDCVGASVDTHGVCFHHRMCHQPLSAPECLGSGDPAHQFLEDYCVHGSWNASSHSCVCTYATYGDRCDNYISGCLDLVHAGYASNATYTVILDPLQDGTSLVKVDCFILSPSFYNIAVLKNAGGVDFNRTWDEYVSGFREDGHNLWVGLEPWHILSSAGLNTLYLSVYFTNGANVFREYVNFVMDGEDFGFSFTCTPGWNSGKGNVPAGSYVGDCLSPLQGRHFSTWDRPAEPQNGSVVDENCGAVAGAGWWWYDHDDSNNNTNNHSSPGGVCGSLVPCQLLGWGLADYQATPIPQRLTCLGVDIDTLAQDVHFVEIYIQ